MGFILSVISVGSMLASTIMSAIEMSREGSRRKQAQEDYNKSIQDQERMSKKQKEEYDDDNAWLQAGQKVEMDAERLKTSALNVDWAKQKEKDYLINLKGQGFRGKASHLLKTGLNRGDSKGVENA